MTECQPYWIARFTCLGISTFFCVITILIILIEKLYKYLTCLLILFMNVSFLIVMISALCYSDRFTDGHCLYNDTVRYTEQQPWRAFCQTEAFLIHSFWLIGFSFSILLNFFILKVLEYESGFVIKWQYHLVAVCFILPCMIMAAPFIYDGYGPSGFDIIVRTPDGLQAKYAYLFCGWYTDNPERRNYQMLNNSIPTYVLCLMSIYLVIRIQRRQRTLESQDVHFSEKQKNVLGTRIIPVICLIVWFVNGIVRLIPSHQGDPNIWNWILLAINTSFDLLPTIECILFLNYIVNSVPLSVFTFLSRIKSNQVSLLTASSQGFDAADQK